MKIKIIKKTSSFTWFDGEFGNIIEVVDNGDRYYRTFDTDLIKKYSGMDSFYQTNGLFVAKDHCEVVNEYNFTDELERILEID